MLRIISMIILAALLPDTGFAAPVISVAQAHFDFGTVRQGERLEHDFEVENAGDEDLVIERLTGS